MLQQHKTFYMRNAGFLFLVTLIAFLTGCSESSNNKQQSNTMTIADTIKTKLPLAATKTILFFGNSLTAGYGVDPTEAFPALIQQKIDSLKLPYKVINGGVSGETSTDGKQRIDFVLKQQPVDVFVLAWPESIRTGAVLSNGFGMVIVLGFVSGLASWHCFA